MPQFYIALLLATAFGNALSEGSDGVCRAGEDGCASGALPEHSIYEAPAGSQASDATDDETTLLQVQHRLQPSTDDATHGSQFAHKERPKITDGQVSLRQRRKRQSSNQKRIKEKFNQGSANVTSFGDWLDGVSNDLSTAFGPAGGQFHDCLTLTDTVGGEDFNVWGGSFESYKSNIEKLETLMRSPTVLPGSVAVSNLKKDLLLYGQILGPMMDSSERFCTIVVEYIWPMEEEPDCMRFLKEVSLNSAIADPKSVAHWPEVISTSSFDSAFLEICKGHNDETGEHMKVRDIDCAEALDAVKAAHLKLQKNETHAHLLSQVCVLIGLPLSSESFSSLSTMALTSISRRGQYKLFAKAAELTPLYNPHHSNTSSDQRVPQDQFSLSEAMSSKGSRRCDCHAYTIWEGKEHKWCHHADGDPRAWCTIQDHLKTAGEGEGSWWGYCDRICPEIPESSITRDILAGTCCDSRAYGVELGISASMGLILASGVCFAWGWDKPYPSAEQDDPSTCPGNYGIFRTMSISYGLDLDSTGYAAASYFHSYNDVSGKSKVLSAGINFFGIGVGGAHIANPQGKTIGWMATIEFSAGADTAVISPEVNYAWANADAVWEGGKASYDCRRRRRRGFLGTGVCFPSCAWVETRHGRKQMNSLQVGDQVLSIDESGKPIFDDVYFFGHAAPNETSDFLTIHVGGRNLEISEEHFVPTCPHMEQCLWTHRVHKYAKVLKPGDWVWLADPDFSKPEQIVNITLKAMLGLYNPYTLSGTIVVNGIVGSAHSKWILDPLTPDSLMMHIPAIYQTLFLPGRWLYHIAGPSAANFLDVNNPSGSEGGLGPQFLTIFIIMLSAAICCGGFAIRSTMENMSKKDNDGIHMKTKA
jgi:hypothetical protein